MPGVYGKVSVGVWNGVDVDVSMTLRGATSADLTAAIATLTLIRDAMEDGQ